MMLLSFGPISAVDSRDKRRGGSVIDSGDSSWDNKHCIDELCQHSVKGNVSVHVLHLLKKFGLNWSKPQFSFHTHVPNQEPELLHPMARLNLN